MEIKREDIERLGSHFKGIKDPRRQYGNLRHKLINLIVVPFVGVLCGLTEWDEIIEFAAQKKDWFRTFLDMPEEDPCWKTYERLYERLEPFKVAEALQSWLLRMKGSGQRVINIDGKTIRGSDDGEEHKALHIVSAWCGKDCLTLGQVKTEEKSNEITAIPKLLDMIDIKGDVVTIDASVASQLRAVRRTLRRKS